MPSIDILALPPTAQQELVDFYQFLLKKNKAVKKLTTRQTNFKDFLLNIPKGGEGLVIERQQDYPKDIEL